MDNMPLGKVMAVITKNYYGALSKRLEYIGVDRHFTTLILIDAAKEKCTQQYLSDKVNCNKVTMVKILDYLVEKKMIIREMNKDDRRERIIKLTDKCKKIMPEIKKEIIAMNNIALKGFTKKEQELFNYFLKATTLNLKNLPVNTVDIKIKKNKNEN
jgi:DNA-binding MarR family transcriptional regulator